MSYETESKKDPYLGWMYDLFEWQIKDDLKKIKAVYDWVAYACVWFTLGTLIGWVL